MINQNLRLSHRRSARWATAALIVFAMAGTACGGDGEKAAVDEQLGFDAEGIIARQTTVENLLRDCMKAQGFEYTPVDPTAQQAALSGVAGLSEEDFEKQFGYGITTLYEKRRANTGDPNTAIRGKLTATERTAYDKALYGQFADATFAVAMDTGEISRLGGCTKEATEQVFGGAEVLSDLIAKLDELEARMLADPRLIKAIVDWSECMRQAGFDGLANPEQVDSTLLKKLEAIVGPAGSEKASYDEAALAALQREEVSLVTADIICENKHITKVESDVRGPLEETFREANAELIKKVPEP